VSLRTEPLEDAVTLPDGRTLTVRIGVPDDDYVPKRELRLVVVELLEDGRGIAALDTLLEPEQDREARGLLRELVAGLESGSLAPTAAAIEPLVDTLR
jgi:hypothetical protein